MAELHDWQGVGSRSADGYEWFYFDAEHAQTQSAVFISIMGPNPFDFTPFDMLLNGDPGPRCPDCASERSQLRQNHYGVAVGGIAPQVPNQEFEAEGYHHLSNPATQVTFSPDPWKLTLPGATVVRSMAPSGLPIYVVELDVDSPPTRTRVKGTLTFTATQKEWKVPGAVLFEDAQNPAHQHCWAVHVPRAHVAGELTVTVDDQSVTIPVDQWAGYHDHNWGTQRVAAGYGRWMWGRALLPDGTTVIAASIMPRSASGEASQRVPQVSVVLSPDGSQSEILTHVTPANGGGGIPIRNVPDGIETPMQLSFGASPADRGHHLRFDTLKVVRNELPRRYQRRIALVTLTSAAGPPAQGIGVTETLVAANFP